MQGDIRKVLIDRGAIARGVADLARRITADLTPPGQTPGSNGRELTLVPILTGSIIFVADLIRCLPLRMKIRLLSLGSYPGKATTSRGVQLHEALTRLPDSFAGAHVLLIDDILDSGRTLTLACELLRARGPASLRTCVLLRKQRPEALAFQVDYACFDIPDEFVVGYGLDYNDYYRNLPDIVALRPEVFKS
jgi:hypoxanthine phosphoribosyltransferase